MEMIDFDKLPRFKEKSVSIMQMIPEWMMAFNCEQEAIARQIYIAHAWIDSNPKLGPKKNMVRFLFNWLTKAHKFGNLRAKPRENFHEKPPEDEVMSGADWARMKEEIKR